MTLGLSDSGRGISFQGHRRHRVHTEIHANRTSTTSRLLRAKAHGMQRGVVKSEIVGLRQPNEISINNILRSIIIYTAA